MLSETLSFCLVELTAMHTKGLISKHSEQEIVHGSIWEKYLSQLWLPGFSFFFLPFSVFLSIFLSFFISFSLSFFTFDLISLTVLFFPLQILHTYAQQPQPDCPCCNPATIQYYDLRHSTEKIYTGTVITGT